jgi:hypothetical protein
MSVRSDASAAAAAERARAAAAARARAEAQRKAAEAKARAAAEAAAKKKAAEQKKLAEAAKKTDAFKAGKREPLALDGRPTAPSASSIAQSRAAAPTPAPAPEQSLGQAKKPEDLPKVFPELKGADKETVKKAWDAMQKVAHGTGSEKLKGLADLSKQFPTTLGNVLDRLGVKDNKLAKLATNPSALSALSTLTDPKKGVTDKAQAALSLAKSVGDTFKKEELEGVLKTTLQGLPAAEKLVGAIGAWADPSKSGLDKARATLDLAGALKDFAGAEFPKLANDLRALDGPLKAAGAALKLLDPKASTQDKALAAAQLAAELPDLKRNVTAFKDLLQRAGVKDAAAVAEAATAAADVAVKGLDPRLASTLTEAQTRQLGELAKKVGPEQLESVLKGVTDKQALDALTGQLGKLDGPAAKRLASTLGGLEHGVLQQALKNPELAESLGKLARNLDDAGAKTVARLVKDFDEAGLKALTKLTDNLGPDALKGAVKLLGPIADKGGSKLAGQALRVLDGTLAKMGVKITGEVAEKVLKNLVKVVPLAGAIPNAIDAVKYGKEAAELHSQNKDLGMFAANMAKLNVLDGAVGVALDLTGVGVGVNIAASVAFSAVSLAGDIAFDAEKKKMLADPKNYQAPDWMKAVNLAAAAAQGPAGMVELAAYYGPEGAAQLTQWGIEKGAKGAIDVARFAGVSQAEATGEQLKLAGKMMHALADVVRNPGKYGQAVADAARDTLNSAIEKGGELARQARQVITDVVNDARAAGKRGLDTLAWIAKNPGPAAELALNGVKDVINRGVDLTTAAGKELYKSAVSTLQSMREGWEGLKGAAREKAKALLESAQQGLRGAVDRAVALGERGVDLVVWAATNPGEVGRLGTKAVEDALAKGGELAKKTWDGIRALGNKGLALAESAVTSLRNAGEAAVDTLKYVIQNPGEAASRVRDWAGQTLSDLVKAGGQAARKAAGAIKDFIDARADWAMKFGQQLVKDGAQAFMDVAKAWKDNLTEGGKVFMDGLKDLGSAGVEQLDKLAKLGGKAAEYAVGRLESLAKAGVSAARTALGKLADLGGEVGRYAKGAVTTLASYTNGEFTVFGRKVDLNPLW